MPGPCEQRDMRLLRVYAAPRYTAGWVDHHPAASGAGTDLEVLGFQPPNWVFWPKPSRPGGRGKAPARVRSAGFSEIEPTPPTLLDLPCTGARTCFGACTRARLRGSVTCSSESTCVSTLVRAHARNGSAHASQSATRAARTRLSIGLPCGERQQGAPHSSLSSRVLLCSPTHQSERGAIRPPGEPTGRNGG